MAIPEDVEMWMEFPAQLKIEPLDGLYDDSKPLLTKKLHESPPAESLAEEDVVLQSSEKATADEVKTKSLEVVGTDGSVVGKILKTSKLYAYEDFVSFLAREGGLDQDNLSRLVSDVTPRPDEDFVTFLLRCNGIVDKQMIERLRQALELEPVFEFPPGRSKTRVKVEGPLDLKVREGEDAASFFARAGSWDFSSSITEELASVGLDEFGDEDAESFFRRTESFSDTVDGDDEPVPEQPDSTITLISNKLDGQVNEKPSSVQVSRPTESSGSVPKDDDTDTVHKKRKHLRSRRGRKVS